MHCALFPILIKPVSPTDNHTFYFFLYPAFVGYFFAFVPSFYIFIQCERKEIN